MIYHHGFGNPKKVDAKIFQKKYSTQKNKNLKTDLLGIIKTSGENLLARTQFSLASHRSLKTLDSVDQCTMIQRCK